MTVDVSGLGTQILIIATNTFPVGMLLTQFSDDADAIDIPTITTGEAKMGVNGDLIRYSKPAIIPAVINIVPGGTDDLQLSILLQANMVGKGKIGARDEITATVTYPDGRFIILREGLITGGNPGLSISSEGRFKTKPYNFSFSSYSSVGV